MRPLIAALVLLPALALAAEPSFVINHQGRLIAADDTPVNTTVTMKFTLYLNHEKPAAGVDTSTWSQESQVEVRQGHYAVLLGQVGDTGSVLDASHLGDGQELRWLGIEVNGQPLLPRQRLTAVPHAVRAAVASRAERADVADGLDCVGCIGAGHLEAAAVGAGALAVGAVGSQHVAAEAIQTAHLQDGSVSRSKLSSEGCSNDQVLVLGDSGWACQTLPEGALYQAGDGLALDGTRFNIPAAGVTNEMIAGNAVTSAKIADGAVTSADLTGGSFPAITGVGTLGELSVSGPVSLSGEAVTVTGANARLSVSGADARLSIGAANPLARLEVRGAAPVAGTGTISTTSATTQVVNGAATQFATQLHVGDVLIAGAQRRTVIDIENATTLTVDTSFTPQLVGGTAFSFQRPVARMGSSTNATAGLTIDANGRVGIGTATPAGALHVQNGPVRIGNTVIGAHSLSLPTGGASTNGYSTNPLHLKTDWICGTTDGVMYQVEFRGYAFSAHKPFHVTATGYMYGTNGHKYDSVQYQLSSSLTVTTYCAGDDKRLVFKLENSVDWHASDLVVNLIGGASGYLRKGADTFRVVAAEHRTSDF